MTCTYTSVYVTPGYMQVVPLALTDDPASTPPPLTQLMNQTWQDQGLSDGDIASNRQLPYQNYFSKLSPR